MFVDLDCLDENMMRISELARACKKKMRIESKSIRVPWLPEYIMKKGVTYFHEVMCFLVSKAAFLATQGFYDLLVAYPTVSKDNLQLSCSLTQEG